MAQSLRITRPTGIPRESPLSFLYQTRTIRHRPYASDAFSEIDTLELQRQARHKISADWSRVNRSPTRVVRRNTKPVSSRYDDDHHHPDRRNPSQQRGRNSLDSRRTSPPPQTPSQERDREWIDHVPFEGIPERPATILDRLQGQTITRHEFNVFKDILSKGAAAAAAEENAAATKRKRRWDSTGRAKGVIREETEMPELLRPLAEEAENISSQHIKKQEEEGKEAKRKADEAMLVKEEKRVRKYREEVQKLIEEQKTDVNLWSAVWEKKLIPDIQSVLLLDHHPQQTDNVEEKKKKEKKTTKGHPALSTLTTTLPSLLLTLITHFRTTFPTSPLPLAILPSLRNLGSRAFALGASTHLYNSHMRHLWHFHTDLDGILQCLEEMDREVYEFDEGTQGLLVEILGRAERVANGQEGGDGLRMWWGMERRVRGLEGLERWEGVVAERVGRAEARREEAGREEERRSKAAAGEEEEMMEEEEEEVVGEERGEDIVALPGEEEGGGIAHEKNDL